MSEPPMLMEVKAFIYGRHERTGHHDHIAFGRVLRIGNLSYEKGQYVGRFKKGDYLRYVPECAALAEVFQEILSLGTGPISLLLVFADPRVGLTIAERSSLPPMAQHYADKAAEIDKRNRDLVARINVAGMYDQFLWRDKNHMLQAKKASFDALRPHIGRFKSNRSLANGGQGETHHVPARTVD